MLKLLNGAGADETGSAVMSPADAWRWFFAGTWGGASIKLEASPDNASWFEVATWSADGTASVSGLQNCWMRARTVGGDGTTDLTVSAP